MLPFRVFDRKKKITWTILNYHPTAKGGEYLASREDDSSEDGTIDTLSVEAVKKLKMVGFVDDHD